MNKEEFFQLLIFLFGMISGAVAMHTDMHHDSSPYFTVTEMVQCRGNICNAVLDMDDIAILVPFDSTKVHVGDKVYLTK